MTTETKSESTSKPEAEFFTDFGLKASILADIAELGYERPTPIQARCIPQAIEGRDIIGLAQTGTGKTAAFGLPIIQRGAHRPEMTALVLAPTRELAQQIATALTGLGKRSGLRVAIVVGGIPIEKDHKALRAWPNVLVATPGRLIDHIHQRTVSLSDIELVTVDEADRMYDMGFMPQIESIMECLPPKRQTLMFTATMPAQVERLVRRHMNDPVRIQVGLTAPPRSAEQQLYHVQETEKSRLLLDLLGTSKGRVLVFVRTKRKVDRVARDVARRHRVARIHGDREQSDREAALLGFRTGACRILIATDIAARGIDVADIEHVINYDFPRSAEDYIHRIGRTARVGAAGLATSFVTSVDRQCLAQVERLIATKLPMAYVGEPRTASGGLERRDSHPAVVPPPVPQRPAQRESHVPSPPQRAAHRESYVPPPPQRPAHREPYAQPRAQQRSEPHAQPRAPQRAPEHPQHRQEQHPQEHPEHRQQQRAEEHPQRRQQHAEEHPQRRQQHADEHPQRRQEQHAEEHPQRRQQHAEEHPQRRQQHAEEHPQRRQEQHAEEHPQRRQQQQAEEHPQRRPQQHADERPQHREQHAEDHPQRRPQHAEEHPQRRQQQQAEEHPQRRLQHPDERPQHRRQQMEPPAPRRRRPAR